MRMLSFFPGPVFGWVFAAVLLGFLAVASWIDVRQLRIPKLLTLLMLGTGLLFNVARGLWLGLEGKRVWLESMPIGPGWGALDGLLFALAGFGLSFGLFFVLWILGVMGGGDVKLFAALGVWIGPKYCLWVFGLSALVMGLVSLVVMGRRLLRRGARRTLPGMSGHAADRGKKAAAGGMLKRGLIPYSPPIAVGTAILLGWLLLAEFRARSQSDPQPQDNVQASAKQ
jgi:Flp pilus assembly protein protease CpaA